MLQASINAFRIPDLRRKILFTFAMLVVFRIVAHVPVPGIDTAALRGIFERQDVGQILGILNIFSGGSLQNFSVAAMGVYPYITASIIFQLLIPIIPRLTELSKEGETGRQKLNQYQHWLTVPLGILQGYGQCVLMKSLGVLPRFDLFGSNWLYSLSILASLVTGTMFLVWLGERITENGVGNGVSIIIFGGIVAGLPLAIFQTILPQTTGGASFNLIGMILFVLISLVTVVGIIMVQEGQRRIPVHYSRNVFKGNRMMRQSGESHIPLRVNSAGMIPLIFAQSIIIFPATVATFFTAGTGWVADLARTITNFFNPNTLPYQILYFLMVVGFTYFYTTVVFSQQNIAENLQKQGGVVPGKRPGPATQQYLTRVLNRITFLGALFLGVVAVLPYFGGIVTGVQFLFSSTALLIVVGVAIDTMKQLEAQLLMRNYEGFIRR